MRTREVYSNEMIIIELLESPKFSKVIPFKSPFRKGGFRGISIGYRKIPPNPPLRKGGICGSIISKTYENFRLSSELQKDVISLLSDIKDSIARENEQKNLKFFDNSHRFR